MSIAKWSMSLDWKEFSVNMADAEYWMKANAGEQYCGNQAHAKLELWFLEEPSQEVKDAISAYWDTLSAASAEALAYKSGAQLATEVAAKKASAKAKLAALGLDAEELKAILG